MRLLCQAKKNASIFVLLIFAIVLMFSETNLAYAQEIRPAVITNVSTAGVGYVNYNQTQNGINAQIGRWDTPYPYPDTGEYAPGLEPYGASYLYIDIDVNDGGLVNFNYRLLTYDAGIWDWLDIYLETLTGTISLVNHLGKPGSSYGSYWESSNIALSQGLNRWRNQHVRLVFAVQQDGWGDQSMAQVISLDLRTCEIPPLTPITDPDAQRFEAGQTIDTSNLTAIMQTALTCFNNAVTNAGGTFNLNSAYRPPQYQLHLQEVYDKWRRLRLRREPECNELKEEVRAEFQRHGGRQGGHPIMFPSREKIIFKRATKSVM